MAKDMGCKLCETSEEPEIGVMLVSDLTGSGQLPFAVGLNCMESFLLGLLETFAQPEGIPAPEPSELDDFPCDECGLTVGHEADCETGYAAEHLKMAAEPSQPFEALLGEPDAPDAPRDFTEDPTEPQGPSGRSRRGSSARAGENGAGASEKTTDLVDIPNS